MSDILTTEEIKKIIPNRYPILYIDKVLEIDPGKKIIAQKNVTINEDFFENMQEPYMLGTLIVETLAQAGSILILKSPQFEGETAYIGGFNKVEFLEKVRPGDVMSLSFEIIKLKGMVGTADAIASVGDKPCVTCQFTFIVGAK